jgi:hypothetical protein
LNVANVGAVNVPRSASNASGKPSGSVMRESIGVNPSTGLQINTDALFTTATAHAATPDPDTRSR